MPPRISPRKPVKVFLAEHRKAKGMTQAEVGERFDPPTDKGTISRFETAAQGVREDNRMLSLNVVAAYAEAVGVPVTALYRPPSTEESLDELIARAPKAMRRIAREQIAALVKKDR